MRKVRAHIPPLFIVCYHKLHIFTNHEPTCAPTFEIYESAQHSLNAVQFSFAAFPVLEFN